ncbi:MAG: hypothetical protein J6J65_01475 [Opitutales bacterium]|nr:hypothetical protein [Opitutales bacterium]
MKKKINTRKCIPQQIAGSVENIKHAIKENCNHVLNAKKFVEKGKSCVFDLCVALVLLARSANKAPTYRWLWKEVFCLDKKEGCPVKPDIYKIAKSLGEVCVKLQSPKKENLRNVGCSRWQTIRNALSRYPKDKREVILNSLASASFDECGEALTQKVNAIAAAANIQSGQKEKSERQKVRDSFNATLKNITDDTQLKALELYLANFNAPKVAMQNDTAEEVEEALVAQPQKSSPEKSATPNQTPTEENLGISISNSPSDNSVIKYPTRANTIQPQENPTNPFPILDGLSDREKAEKIRVWLTKLERREAYKRDANNYEMTIAWGIVKGSISLQEVFTLKTHEDLRKLAGAKFPDQFIPMQDKGDYPNP